MDSNRIVYHVNDLFADLVNHKKDERLEHRRGELDSLLDRVADLVPLFHSLPDSEGERSGQTGAAIFTRAYEIRRDLIRILEDEQIDPNGDLSVSLLKGDA